jgi:predicted SprT family Zn-dependent metalloprotease
MADTAENWMEDLLGAPACSCGATMDLVRMDPHPSIRQAELRTYQCQQCTETLVQTFGDDR